MNSMADVTGLPLVKDENLGTAYGVSILSRNIDVNDSIPIRQDTWRKVLKPALVQPNLYLLTVAKVDQVTFLDNVAIGIHWSTIDTCSTTPSAKEVILSLVLLDLHKYCNCLV
jgi:choline dehydrogenase-like flavoprotein